MQAVENTPQNENDNTTPQSEHEPAHKIEIHSQAQQMRFARDIEQLLQLFDSSDAPRLKNLGFEPHDDGDYFEIEALSFVEEELTQLLGIRQAPFYESDFEASMDFSQEDHELDPLHNLTPLDLDFELQRAYIRKDDEEDTSHSLLLVESRLREEDSDVWCFPDIAHHPDGSTEMVLHKVKAPVMLYFVSGNDDDKKLSVQFTNSAVEQIMADALEDITSLPPSIEYQIQLLALNIAFERRWNVVEYLGPSDLRLQNPQPFDEPSRSFALTIEPLGEFRVMMEHDPDTSSIALDLELIRPFFPKHRR